MKAFPPDTEKVRPSALSAAVRSG